MPTSHTKPLVSPVTTSPTFNLSILVLAYTRIYLIQPSGIGFMPKFYSTAVFGTLALYISGTGPILAAYMQPYGITPISAYLQPWGMKYTSVPYVTPASNAILADDLQPSIGLTHPPVYCFSSVSQPFAITVTTSISYGRKLSNLMKIYSNNAKYSDLNNSFTFSQQFFMIFA